jgi:hypothetical protein
MLYRSLDRSLHVLTTILTTTWAKRRLQPGSCHFVEYLLLLNPYESPAGLSARDARRAAPDEWIHHEAAGGHDRLHDQERIPLKQDIDEYFAREVLPFAPDAWMDRSKDQVGYEISFTKYFYEYQPPRALADILADLEALDAEAEELQEELRA